MPEAIMFQNAAVLVRKGISSDKEDFE